MKMMHVLVMKLLECHGSLAMPMQYILDKKIINLASWTTDFFFVLGVHVQKKFSGGRDDWAYHIPCIITVIIIYFFNWQDKLIHKPKSGG